MKNDLFTQDHYRVLGVARDANHGTIREAYLRLVKKHHPDVSKGAQSEEQFKAIASAWEASGLNWSLFCSSRVFSAPKERVSGHFRTCLGVGVLFSMVVKRAATMRQCLVPEGFKSNLGAT